jgi:GDP/UDP-N,N'-diacetylbacillosamine 2-epimerase (hydrolysing)
LLEAPSFKKGTINIGDRQNGRLKAQSIIDCEPSRSSISNAIERMFSSQFQAQLSVVQNPYGDGGASEAIIKFLESCSLKGILKKRFYNTSIS